MVDKYLEELGPETKAVRWLPVQMWARLKACRGPSPIGEDRLAPNPS